ncbi:hypothetical protein M5X02_20285 [Paenibacillus alvei]|uniref:hypothetical protein n=1 Tax=Paenibacillus alvei TaxID=44250 RepID=UPI0002881965|nr:hypothetical protein [Paenibacillus alvei]EJW13939.1 hypothetical protein PAV_141p00450 [Paenibacillus alvei DSM 29]MCY9542987.1 hypothetical protein [Paenibacillus alvei]MCY9707699.1 hypothetical protein [Paenibacillus alvei]MEC0082788.1 hypothetical protein [Paenibacillus alvei]
MSKDKIYRYAKSKGEYEKQVNIHIREMIEMIKYEEVKKNLYVKGIKLSTHAFKRMKQHFDLVDVAVATRKAKEMLRHAVRLGTVLSYDGRINVLYAYRQTAFFLSPDLKTVVTVNRFHEISYKPVLKKVHDGLDREELLELHISHLREIERKEEEQMRLILSIEQKVREATEQCATMLRLVRGGGRKKEIKHLISEQNHHLKMEGRKLFELKVEKRHLCKSLVSLY